MEFVNRALSLLQKKKKNGNTGCFFKQRKPCGWTLCSLYAMANLESAAELMAAGTS